MQKLYCYVDETGQDTEGAFFLVALIVLSKEREDLRKRLRQIEKRSGKVTPKWTHTSLQQKQAYLTAVFAIPAFHQTMFYHEFLNTTDYLACIIEATAEAISKRAARPYKAVIFIDGLGKPERKAVGSRLRAQQISTEKVRGIRDESDEFIRLADAMAGFVRDVREGKAYAQTFFRRARNLGIITPL